MGGGSSRLDSHRRRRRPPPERTLSSYFSCGRGISSLFVCGAPSQIEDDPAELQVDKVRNPWSNSARSYTVGSGSTSLESQTRGSASKNVASSGIAQSGVGSNDATSTSSTGHLFGSRQILPHRRTSLLHELGETSSDESSNGFQGTAVMAFPNFCYSSTSNSSDSQFSNCTSGGGSGLFEPEGGLIRIEENTIFGDVASISSSDVSATSSLIDNARRNGRLFSDAFSRISRGYHDSRNNLFSNNSSDNLGHHDRWLHDLSCDFLGEGVGGSLRPYENGTQWNRNLQWNSTSEILGSTRDSLENIGRRTTTCLTGMHPRGPCSCESILRGESSGTRASISRVIMIAEAFFEVLDEVDRQPLSGPLPVVQVPAEESVVNSLPMKNYKKPEESVCSDDTSKCYICLDEYEDGDNIRILPCQHDYHVSCIDKWLKEIHSVCPLCRADVHECFT